MPINSLSSVAASCGTTHQARSNDSWTRISARFGVPLKTLLTLNKATTVTPLFIGDTLCISMAPPEPVVVIPKNTYKRKEVIAIIREVWPDEHEENALFVADRESNFNPAVRGGGKNCCYGLFQIYWSVHKSWLANAGVADPAQLFDPRVNAQAALQLFQRNGSSWRPWWTSSWRP